MLAVNFSTIREKFKEYCDRVTDDSETVIITRKDEKNVVIISLDEYNFMIKAIKNAEYLRKLDISFEQEKAGHTIIKTLDELDALADE